MVSRVWAGSRNVLGQNPFAGLPSFFSVVCIISIKETSSVNRIVPHQDARGNLSFSVGVHRRGHRPLLLLVISLLRRHCCRFILLFLL